MSLETHFLLLAYNMQLAWNNCYHTNAKWQCDWDIGHYIMVKNGNCKSKIVQQ